MCAGIVDDVLPESFDASNHWRDPVRPENRLEKGFVGCRICSHPGKGKSAVEQRTLQQIESAQTEWRPENFADDNCVAQTRF
jgi:hypothetical protein